MKLWAIDGSSDDQVLQDQLGDNIVEHLSSSQHLVHALNLVHLGVEEDESRELLNV